MHLAWVGAGSLGTLHPDLSPAQAIWLFLAVSVCCHVKGLEEPGGGYQELRVRCGRNQSLIDRALELEMGIVPLGQQQCIM